MLDKPIHHANTKSNTFKKDFPDKFRMNGHLIIQKYINLFPTWVEIDIMEATNPLSVIYGDHYKKIKQLNQTCVDHWP
jgi:hypothetical protein